jgi:hypothetical protein
MYRGREAVSSWMEMTLDECVLGGNFLGLAR